MSSNLNLTIKLAKQSIKSGVKKFIYVSSIKVNGTFSSSPFSYLDSPNPKDVYANNKLEIENKLIDLVRDSKMDLIIVRPPLVYGAGAKGNFRNLKKLVDLNLPLPFANLNNKRSFISIQNLCSFLFYCLDMNTKNQIFLVSDNEDISVKDFIKKISYSRNKKIKLFSFPIFLLKHIFKVLYGEDSSNSFFNSLQIKCSETIDLTGWNPKYSVEESLELD